MTVSKEYQQALQGLHKRHKWGTTGGAYAGDDIVKILKKHPDLQTVLDYGCGRGHLKTYVESQGITDRKWTLYDPGVKDRANKPVGTFDLVITTDVLEHVEPIMQDAVLTELCGYTNQYLFNEIACYKTKRTFKEGPYIGQDLHINLKIPCLWKQEIEALAQPLGLMRTFSRVSLIDGWKVRYLSVLWREQ